MNLYNLTYMFSKDLLMLHWRLGFWVSLHAYNFSLNCMFLYESHRTKNRDATIQKIMSIADSDPIQRSFFF